MVMGIFDKLKFWKKDNLPDLNMPGGGMDAGLQPGMAPGTDNIGMGSHDLGLPGETPGQNPMAPPGMPPMGQPGQPMGQPMGQQLPPQMAPPGFTPNQQQPAPIAPAQPTHGEQMVAKDIEVLSYKLDTLKAALDMINQRLANIEKLASGETERKRW